MGKAVDISGQRFGRLTAVSLASERIGAKSERAWHCVCDCGKQTIVLTRCLRFNNTKSCGCLKRDASEATFSANRTTHGLSHHKLYRLWLSIKRRCHNASQSNYYLYGGRGIRMSDKWVNDFAAFLSDVGEPPSAQHSLDRIDPNGHYEPGNVRWATPRQQQNNKTNNCYVVYRGTRMSFQDACRAAGDRVVYGTAWHRLRTLGWTVEKAVETPPLH